MKTYIKHYPPHIPLSRGVYPVRDARGVLHMILRRKILMISTFVLIFFLPIAYLTTCNLSTSDTAWYYDNSNY